MPDNLIQVGAVVDLGQYKAGMQEAVATTERATQEISQSFERVNASTHEAMAGMAFAVEDSGIKMSRHFRRMLTEIPMVNAAFTALMPLLALQVGITILKDVSEKVSTLIADTFIFTDAMKAQDAAVKSSNKALEDAAVKVKQLGRETELAAAKTAVEKERLRLQFKLEDLGGNPAALRAKLEEAENEFKRLSVVMNDTTHPKFGMHNEFGEMQDKINELSSVTIPALQAALKVADAEVVLGGRNIGNELAAAADKAAKEEEARHTKFVSMVYAERQAMADKADAHQKAEAEETVAVLRETEKQNNAIIKAIDEQIRAYEIIQEAARAHEAALGQIADQRISFELQIGKLSEGNYEKQLQAQLAATYANERAKLEAKRQAAEGNVVEQAKVDGELKKLDDKYLAESEKAEQQSYLRRRQKFDQYFQQVSQSFNNALNSWIAGTQTAAQAFSQMFQQIIVELISFVERWIEKKIEMWLIDKLLGDQGQQTQVSQTAESNAAMALSDAFVAAANAYAPLAYDPPAAATAAGIAYAAVAAMSLGAGSVAGFAIGTNYVPQDGLAYLHKGEEIIPANKQGPGYKGGGGLTIVVNHSVSAVDAESFQGHIRKHGNMIGQEVARVLKRKGIK